MKASLVIPCYNAGRFLPIAMHTAREQSAYLNEVIIVNDGSTDDYTLKVLKQYDKEATILNLETNKGLAAARNAGARQAQSPYVFFLDADDYLEDGFLKEALQAIEHDNQIGAVSSFFLAYHLNNVGRITTTSLNRSPGGDVLDYLISNRSCGCALVRKDTWQAIGGYDELMKHGMEDWEFWLRLTASGNTIHILKHPYYHYHVRASSMFLNIKNYKHIYKYMAHKHKTLCQSYAGAFLPRFYHEVFVKQTRLRPDPWFWAYYTYWPLTTQIITAVCLTPLYVLYYCLLYTSPSPRDRQKSRMPSSA